MLEPELLRSARARAREALEAEKQLELAQAHLHHALRELHLHGGTTREIGAALGLSHQRVAQVLGRGGPIRRWLQGSSTEARIACSFCGRDSSAVERMVAGPKTYACDRCVRESERALREAGGAAIRVSPQTVKPSS